MSVWTECYRLVTRRHIVNSGVKDKRKQQTNSGSMERQTIRATCVCGGRACRCINHHLMTTSSTTDSAPLATILSNGFTSKRDVIWPFWILKLGRILIPTACTSEAEGDGFDFWWSTVLTMVGVVPPQNVETFPMEMPLSFDRRMKKKKRRKKKETGFSKVVQPLNFEINKCC